MFDPKVGAKPPQPNESKLLFPNNLHFASSLEHGREYTVPQRIGKEETGENGGTFITKRQTQTIATAR
jgi:hypothetical protein